MRTDLRAWSTDSTHWLSAAALAVAMSGGLALSQEHPREQQGKPLSAAPPALQHTLRDLDGRQHRLADGLPDRAVLLWFTNFCPGCEERFPFVERLGRRHSDSLAIFAISVLGDDRKTVARMREALHPSFPLLLDPGDVVAGDLGLKHAPNACPLVNAVLVARNGEITWRGHLSAAKDDDIEAAVTGTIGMPQEKNPEKKE